MKNDDLKTIQQNILSFNPTYNIIAWGSQNDYPQQILRLVNNSSTAQECVNIFVSFLYGNGFEAKHLNNIVVNQREETFAYLLNKICYDYAVFGGFAFHVKYNAFLDVREVYHVPFEQIRLSVDKQGEKVSALALHEDWGKEYQKVKRFEAKDIKRLTFFNNDRENLVAEILQSGSVEQYPGQIFYYSNIANCSYPCPMYSSAMKDMNTEDGISIVDNRNAYSRFMPSGALVQILGNNGLEEALFDEKQQAFSQAWQKAQGPDNLGKIITITVQDKDDVPQFINMQPNNYAEDYKATSEKIRRNIRQAFHLPPILCSESVNTGFDTDAMLSAFTYYNSQTKRDRDVIVSAFTKIFTFWFEDLHTDTFNIEPAKWN